jgi:surface antigen
MKASKVAVAGIVSVSLGLASCESGGISNEDVGFLLGAAAGGLLGSQFGSGTGQLAATALGAVLGGVAGRAVAKRLTRQDYAYMDSAAYNAVNTGQTQNWSNPTTGASGTATPGQTFTQNGQTCRSFTQSVTAQGETGTGNAVACQQPDGSWRLQQA